MRILLAVLLIAGCASQVKVYKGDPKVTDPVVVIEGVPESGEVKYKDEDVELSMKAKGGGWNPIEAVTEAVTGVVALVFGRSTPAMD